MSLLGPSEPRVQRSLNLPRRRKSFQVYLGTSTTLGSNTDREGPDGGPHPHLYPFSQDPKGPPLFIPSSITPARTWKDQHRTTPVRNVPQGLQRPYGSRFCETTVSLLQRPHSSVQSLLLETSDVITLYLYGPLPITPIYPRPPKNQTVFRRPR